VCVLGCYGDFDVNVDVLRLKRREKECASLRSIISGGLPYFSLIFLLIFSTLIPKAIEYYLHTHTYIYIQRMKTCIGQDLSSIKKHINNFGIPDEVMFYTNITQIKGIDGIVDYGSGIQSLSKLKMLYDPKEGEDGPLIGSVNIGLWLSAVPGLHSIISGELDDNLRTIHDAVVKQR
jgi:hypothetical protein